MSEEQPKWLEPELRAEAIRRLREGDHALVNEWLSLVTGRFAAFIDSQIDQTTASIRDLQALNRNDD